MKIVIDISDSLYGRLVDMNVDSDTYSFNESALVESIQNGIPLPKEHGDLVDRNSFEYLKTIHDAVHGKISWSDALHKIRYSAPTIIPATKEGDGE